MQQVPAYGIHRGEKPQHLADGGIVKGIRSLISSFTDNRKPDEAPVGTGAVSQAKSALTGRAKTIDDAEKKAVGMAKGGAVRKMMKAGGEIPGKSPTPTADNIPISATAGEFMIRQPAVQVIGVDVLKAINKLGGKAAPATDKKPGGAVRRMYDGGEVKKDEQAVFGLYPQLAGGKRTTYATDNALRSGVVATGPSSFEPALTPAAPAITANGPGTRLGATQDTRSTLAAAPAPVQPQPLSTPAVQPIATAAAQPNGATLPNSQPAGGVRTLASTLASGGQDVGGGITRYNAPGASPLFTNRTDAAGQADNAALLSRAPITAQNQGALDGIQARQDAAQQGRANKDTYDAQVADAQRANQFELDKNLRAAALGTPSFRGSKAIRPSRAAREILAQDQRAASEQAGFGITRRGQDIDAQRNAATQQGQAADRKLAQDKFDLEKDGAKLDQKARGQLSALQDTILDPQASPEVRKSAIATYRALTGKADTQNRFTVVPGGQAIDPTTNAAYTLPSQVIDNQTGQFVQQQGQGGKPAQNFTQGQTYTDAKGNKAKWDGQKFVPA